MFRFPSGLHGVFVARCTYEKVDIKLSGLIFTAFFGGHDDYPVGCSWSVKGRGGSIFQNLMDSITSGSSLLTRLFRLPGSEGGHRYPRQQPTGGSRIVVRFPRWGVAPANGDLSSSATGAPVMLVTSIPATRPCKRLAMLGEGIPLMDSCFHDRDGSLSFPVCWFVRRQQRVLHPVLKCLLPE